MVDLMRLYLFERPDVKQSKTNLCSSRAVAVFLPCDQIKFL